MTRYKYNKEFFYNETPELAYFLGYFMSDGCIQCRKGAYKVSIHLNIKDLTIIKLFRDWICKDLLINKHTTVRDSGYITVMCGINICNKEIVEFLINKYKINTNKTFYPVVPDGLSKELLPHFIRGVFDGDGCVHVKKTENNRPLASIASASKEYLLLLKEIIGHGSVNKQSTIYLLNFTNLEDVLYLRDYMYGKGGECLIRKKELFYNCNTSISGTNLSLKEKEFIIQNRETLTKQEIQDVLNRSERTINLSNKTDNEIKVRNNDNLSLIRLSNKNISSSELSIISDYFDLGVACVKRFVRNNGFGTTKEFNSYTIEETNHIISNFNPDCPGESSKLIGNILNKPADGIYHKALRFGLIRNKKLVTKDEINTIKDNIHLSNKVLRKMTKLGLTTIKRYKRKIKLGEI